MDLIEIIVGSLDDRVTEAKIAQLIRIAETAAAEREDARTYKQAITAAIVFADRIGNYGMTWRLAPALFEVIQRALPTIEPDYFRLWIGALARKRPIDVLLL